MDTLKTTSTTTSMLLIATIIMVQHLVEVMTSIWRIMLVTIIILTLIATRTQVPIVIIISGPEALVSAPTTQRFTMKWFLRSTRLLTKSTRVLR